MGTLIGTKWGNARYLEWQIQINTDKSKYRTYYIVDLWILSPSLHGGYISTLIFLHLHYCYVLHFMVIPYAFTVQLLSRFYVTTYIKK